MSITEKRITPDGHEVAPGALAQGYPTQLPGLRVEALYASVDPDTFVGRVLAGGVEVATTPITETEPEAILAAEQLVADAVARLFGGISAQIG